MRKDTVSIGGASGFWGDSVTGPMQLVASGRIDFLVFDFLAELTMSLLASARMKNAELGYATDFVSVAMRAVLKDTSLAAQLENWFYTPQCVVDHAKVACEVKSGRRGDGGA